MHGLNRQGWIGITLLALMLVVQTASASHGIEHQSIDHTELCQAFVTADHAPAIELAAQLIGFENTRQEISSFHSTEVDQAIFLRQNARAPPIS